MEFISPGRKRIPAFYRDAGRLNGPHFHSPRNVSFPITQKGVRFMKRLSLFATLVLALSTFANAQFEGFGWDGDESEVVGRIGLGGYNHLEIGANMLWDESLPDNTSAQEDAKMTITASARFLMALHQWEKLTGFLHLGVYFRDDAVHGNAGDREGTLQAFAGYEPEVILIPHLAVGFKFGLRVPLVPDAGFGFTGKGVSIVDGLNFRILF
jgi:hypothetical protein